MLATASDSNDRLERRRQAEELCIQLHPEANFDPVDVSYDGGGRWRVQNTKATCFVRYGKIDPVQEDY